MNTVNLLMWAGALAPAPTQDQRPPNAPEFGGSSPIGLVVILLLFIAVFFLIRSMNKHLGKVPASFDRPEPGPDVDAAADDDPPDAPGAPGPATPGDRPTS